MNILRKLVFTRINKPPVCLYSTRGNVTAPQLDMSLKNAKNAAKRIVWVDLEMTGLNVDTDHILEIACLVTDADLNVVATGPNIIINQPNSILENMHPWCINQHEWIDRGQSQFQGIT